MVLVFYHYILLSMFLFSLLWQKWASIHFLITVEEEKHRLTEEQPMTVTTTKKQTKTKNKQTSSARHRYNAICSTCIQLISAPNPSSISATYAQTHQLHSYPWVEFKLVPFLDLGIKLKQESFISTRESEKQKIQKIVDCAFDYLGFIWRRVAAVRP